MKCCMCERPRFNDTTQYCWLHARTIANLQGRTVMEVANCAYEGVENWALREFLDRVRSVRPKLALKVEGLLEHLDGLSVAEAEMFAGFTPAECEFLRSRLDEIFSASIEMMA